MKPQSHQATKMEGSALPPIAWVPIFKEAVDSDLRVQLDPLSGFAMDEDCQKLRHGNSFL